MSKSVLIEVAGQVGTLTLNRPDQHNAFDAALIAELSAALHKMNTDASVRIVILSATGKSFCAGADVAWMARAANYGEEENYQDAMQLADLMCTLNRLGKPTIARVHGSAFGGGLGLVACCDMAVATHNASFALSEVRLGLVPAVISPYVIGRIGEGMARRYFLTSERFNAAEAYRIGLVNQVVASETELGQVIGQWIEALLLGGPQAQKQAKRLIASICSRPIMDALIQDTAERIAHVRASPEGREGVAAFLEKRKPNWLQ